MYRPVDNYTPKYRRCAPTSRQTTGAQQKRETLKAFKPHYIKPKPNKYTGFIGSWILIILFLIAAAFVMYGLLELPIWLYGHFMRGWW